MGFREETALPRQFQGAWLGFRNFNVLRNYMLYSRAEPLVLSGICRHTIDFDFNNDLLKTKTIID